MASFKGTIEERFLSHVSPCPFSGCWFWMSQLNHNGYGVFAFNQRPEAAHRMSYRLFRGSIPEELQVDHACHDPKECNGGPECPHRKCVNPRHLQLLTLQDNLKRGGGNRAAVLAIKANCAKITHCPQGHEYSETNTVRYDGKRQCVTCRKWRGSRKNRGLPVPRAEL